VAGDQVARWLGSVAVEERDGHRRPERPELSASGSASLGWGGLGPIVFYADAYRTLALDCAASPTAVVLTHRISRRW
jgi:hypothetical protein